MTLLPETMPHADLTERAFVGLLLTWSGETPVALAAQTLDPVDFYNPETQAIFVECRKAIDAGRQADAGLVSQALPDAENAIAKCMTRVPPPEMAHDYAQELRNISAARKAIMATRTAAERIGQDGSTTGHVDDLRKRLDSIEACTVSEPTPEELYESILVEEDERRERAKGRGFAGIPTGFHGLDKILGGILPGLTVIGGRKSMGKSSLLVGMVVAGMLAGKRYRIVSLDMEARSYVHRITAAMNRMPVEDWTRGKASDEQHGAFRSTVAELLSRGVYISESSPDIDAIERQALAKSSEWDVLAVDYLQVIRVKGTHGIYDRVTEATVRLKALGRKVRKPVVLLSQIPNLACRAGQAKQTAKVDPRPSLEDLKGSGDIGDMATVVIFPWRPNAGKWGGGPNETCELIVGKNQGGNVGVAEVMWHGPTERFYELAEEAAHGSAYQG